MGSTQYLRHGCDTGTQVLFINLTRPDFTKVSAEANALHLEGAKTLVKSGQVRRTRIYSLSEVEIEASGTWVEEISTT